MRRRCERGLTLVEILVVFAVIAILAAILFPVFRRAKDNAYQATCASNLRQLGAAFFIYASDWSGVYPSPGGLIGDRHYWSQSADGGLKRYVGDECGGFGTVWCCPLMREWNCPYPVRSYGMNSFLRSPSDIYYPGSVSILTPIRQDAIPVPRGTILLYEGIQVQIPLPKKPEYAQSGVYIYRCGDWTEVRGWYPRPAGGMLAADTPMHGRVNNYLYCDGHVVARPPGRHVSQGSKNVTWEEATEWFVDKAKCRAMYP